MTSPFPVTTIAKRNATEARALRPGFVQAELARLGLTEWTLILECSRADRCSVNRCPLDPLIALRTEDPFDRETRCPVSKPDRQRFVARKKNPEMQALLPFGGLLESEWNRREAGRRRFASMTPEQREKARAASARGLAALRQARLIAASNPADPGAGSDPSRDDSGAKRPATGARP